MHHVQRAEAISSHEADRILLSADLLYFLKFVFLVLNPGRRFEPNWHLETLAASLHQIRDGEVTNLLVNAPPRSLKSMTISVAFVAWSLGLNPTLRFMCVSYGEELAHKLARDCRKVMQHPRYRAAFPDTRLSRLAQNDFETTAGGGRLSDSIAGGLTGRGADIVIVDDPIKPDDARSETMRITTEKLYRETLSSRLDSKTKGIFVVVMQRLHEEDLSGTLLKTGDWSHLCLPAITPCTREMPLLYGNSHLWRLGEALDETREPLEVLERQRRLMRDAAFSAQYLQAPLPESGARVRREWLREYEVVPERRERDSIIQSWDCANGIEDTNDFSVCVTILVRDNKFYLLNVERVRLMFPDLRARVIALAQSYRADMILIEDAASGRPLLQEFERSCPAGVPTPVGRIPDGGKEDRLARASFRIEAGDLYLPRDAPWRAEFERELLGFPYTKHDDQVDALSQALVYLADQSPLLDIDPLASSRPSPWLGVGSRDDYDNDDDPSRDPDELDSSWFEEQDPWTDYQ